MKPIRRLDKPCHTHIELDTNQVFAIEGQRGTSILCVRGQVWVTQEGDPRDYIVSRGLRFVAPRPGYIVVNGVADHSTVTVRRVASARCGPWAQQPLRIDWQCFAQIESEARRARTAYFAAAWDSCAARTNRAWHSAMRWLAGLITIVVRRKPWGTL